MIKVKVRKVKENRDRDKKSYIDKDNYSIPDDLKRLSKGIMEDVIVPDDDVIYQKVKYIQKLNKQIEVLEAQVRKLIAAKDKLTCKKPSTEELFTYCDQLNDVAKGKFRDKKK
tara:strand:- start:162 stop:500 length:339 start_codon:yes stop_codon:yes gene_type:complete